MGRSYGAHAVYHAWMWDCTFKTQVILQFVRQTLTRRCTDILGSLRHANVTLINGWRSVESQFACLFLDANAQPCKLQLVPDDFFLVSETQDPENKDMTSYFNPPS
jgi:hypothetical protein